MVYKKEANMGNRIMVVDDDMDFLTEVQDTLELYGYQPVPVNDSGAVIDMAKQLQPDAIVLDIHMDGVNGFQIRDRLSQSPQTMHIPVIAMSGYFPTKDHLKFLKLFGMDTCLQKPFTINNLIRTVQKAVHNEGVLV